MKKKRFKQGAALALSFAMILGMMPAVTKPLEVRAATTNILPTTTQFATKAELMTKYDLVDSTDATVQKVIFGQNGSGTAQEWKIAGTDTGIADNNIVLFAATPLGSNVVFNSTTSTKTYDSDWKCTYDSAPSTVNPNHYGGSDLRQTISNLLDGESYFSTAEQGKMNTTTITTKDTYNNTTYTTTDKLYAGYSEVYGSSYTSITVGTLNSGLTIDKSNWGSGAFWQRAPYIDNGSGARLAVPGDIVDGDNVYSNHAVVPAFDLNLSSVIFASAASAATSDGGLSTKTGDTDNAFTLRYASSGGETATINEAGSEVAITGATDNMYLVVQNSTGAYAKALTSGTTSVKASEIEGIADFYNCQVWLESTNATSRITTATEPTTKAAPSTTDITSVAITGITAPTVGSNLDTTAACAITGVQETTPAVTWTPSATTAGYNTAYTASVVLTADTNYQFTTSTAATINGNDATSITKNEDGSTLTVTYEFGATEKNKLTSITAPSPMTVANGTAYGAMNLPSTVGIVTEGTTATTAAVQWDTTTPASGSYDSSVLTEQSVTLNGTVTCPDSIDQNNVTLSTTITITISAAGIVGAPTFGIATGTYTSNQSVTLTSTTDGATIYYTTDGNEPTTGSSVYSSPISVTGVAGESKSITIKAIAVKSGMQTSSVSSATYVIQIPAPSTAPSITTQPANATVNSGQTATFTVVATGSPTPTYQWQVDRNTGSYVDIEGATGASYTTSVVDTTCNGYKYRCVVTNSAGTVNSNEATLTVNETSAATYTVTVNNGSGDGNYVANATVTITADAAPSGKVFDKWEVVKGSVTLGSTTNATTTFTMSAGEVEVTATYKDAPVNPTPTPDPDPTPDPTPTPGTGTISKDPTVIGEGAPTTNMNNTADDLKNKVLTNDELARVAAGESAVIYLDVKNMDSSITASEKQLIAARLGDDTLGIYLDISLYKKVGSNEAVKVTNPNGKVSVSIKITAGLINTDTSKTRTYKIVRIHDGVASVIEGTYDSKTQMFTFETDEFSTYALIYSDSSNSSNSGDDTTPAKDEVPKTGDNTPVVWLFVVALISGAGVLYFGKKKRGVRS